MYFCFIDYIKAFDCVDHNKLWKILQEMGIPDHLTCLLRNLCAGQEATIRTGHGTTDWFNIGKGVRQGTMLSPCLFNFYAELLLLFSHSNVSNSLQPHGLQHTCPLLPPGDCSKSHSLSQRGQSTISSYVVHILSCFQSFPKSGSFLMNWLFISGGQSIGASASASVLLMNI